jgi:hypothetical protein
VTATGEVVLSPAGALRRHAMLVELAGRVVRRRRRRQVARAALAGAVVVALLYGVVPWPAPRPDDAAPVANARIVGNDPQILARCTVVAAVPKDVFVGDGELRELLRSAGQDVGIARSGGRVLVPGFVADDWQERPAQ